MKNLMLAIMLTTCFLVSHSVSGMNRICVYKCHDGDYAITIDSYKRCPMSVKK
jgi:hypothetical protein